MQQKDMTMLPVAPDQNKLRIEHMAFFVRKMALPYTLRPKLLHTHNIIPRQERMSLTIPPTDDGSILLRPGCKDKEVVMAAVKKNCAELLFVDASLQAD